MKWLTWDYGRQKSGYSKLLLAISKRFKFDCYLIRVPGGCDIPEHTDPAVDGYEHHRINITLNRPAPGTGRIYVAGPVRWIGKRIMIFRPDLYRHSMTSPDFLFCNAMYILTIGWLKKKP